MLSAISFSIGSEMVGGGPSFFFADRKWKRVYVSYAAKIGKSHFVLLATWEAAGMY